MLRPKKLQNSQLLNPRAILIRSQSLGTSTKQEAFNKDERNSAVEYYCQVTKVTNQALRAKLSLLARLHEPCFDQLRTKDN